MDIMERIRAMTNGHVAVGPGTLYNLLEQFCEADMIRETKAEGRRRSYILTQHGMDILNREVDRLQRQIEDHRKLFG